MARTSRSASSLANTPGISAQNAGPIALPLPGPIRVTCATWFSMSTVTDSYASTSRPMPQYASQSARRRSHQYLADSGLRQELTGRLDQHLADGFAVGAERVVLLFEDFPDDSQSG